MNNNRKHNDENNENNNKNNINNIINCHHTIEHELLFVEQNHTCKHNGLGHKNQPLFGYLENNDDRKKDQHVQHAYTNILQLHIDCRLLLNYSLRGLPYHIPLFKNKTIGNNPCS